MAVKQESFRGQTFNTVEGVVDHVYFNEIPKDQIKTYKNDFTPKFRIRIQMTDTDGDTIYIGVGLSEKASLAAKDVNGKYQDVTAGAKINADVDVVENGKYTNYNTTNARIKVLEVGAPVEEKPVKSNTSYQKRDNSGMEAGHCINAAYCLLNYKPKDSEEVVEYAEKLHNITNELKKEYKSANPDMTDYDVGASVGHAVLNACRMLTKTKLDEVKATAEEILLNISAPILVFVKGEEAPPVATPPKEDFPVDDDIPF